MLNLRQIHRLNTDEDPFHSHKVLGAIALCNFAWRLWLHFAAGDAGLTRAHMPWVLLAHGALHLTSFQFRLSKRRNRAYNIIWPEMRWHTMIFAFRSLAAMAVVTYLPNFYASLLRGPIVILTMICADAVTHYYKHVTAQVDEKDSTMRGTPYPSWVSPRYASWHNTFYSASQVLGTMNVLAHRDPVKLFMLLLPIQTAPFCMTLVKKGIMTQGGWHVYYTLAILANYALLGGSVGSLIIPSAVYDLIAALVVLLRFRFNVNKYALWGSAICVQLWYVVTASRQ